MAQCFYNAVWRKALFESKKISKTYEQIIGYIREAIANEQLRPGDRLPTEKQLAFHFGVSRPTVREAIKVLEAMNVLRTSTGPSGGIHVQQLDGVGVADYLKDSLALLVSIDRLNLREVGAAREIIEIPLAGQAALHRTDKNLEQLWTILDEDQYKDNQTLAADISFHRCMAEAAQNRLLCLFVDAIHQALGEISKNYVIPYMKDQSQSQHVAIYEAIKAQDHQAAEARMREHLHFASQIYSKALKV